MDTTKIIKGVVNSGRYTVTAPIVKEDYGLYLQIEGVELPSTYEVDFSNSEHSGTSVTMIGNSDGVLIPHQFIDTGKDIFAFLYHVGANYGKTVYKFRIPNKVRPDRTNEEPTPEEQSVIDQAISALNEAVAQTAQDKADADVSAQNASADAERAEEARTDAQNYATQAEQARDDAQTYANNASASATASANSASASAQIKADVEDLVDDAQGYAQASAQSASASANSASQAQGYAQSASASAQSASGYATQADISANTASNKASEASTSASTASAKATESAQSASQALSYKNDAESAKTASQTAQGLAESARDSAVQAKTDAESARDEAQNLVDGISGKVEQIDANTASVASLEEDRYKPYVVDTASGAIASFSDGADDIPLKSLVVDINPVQDLHGQDAPYPAGGGVNQWDEEWEVGGINAQTGEPVSNTTMIRSKNFCACISGEVYAKVHTPTSVINVFWYDESKNFISVSSGGGNSSYFLITAPENAKWFKVRTDSAYGATYNHDISINYPSTDHDYHPYENLCPISGWTEVNVNHSDADMTNPTTLTISLGQAVYGGKLDVLSGVLVIDRAMVDLGTLNYAIYNHATLGQYFYTNVYGLGIRRAGEYPSTTYPSICSAFKCVSRNATVLVNGTYCFDGDAARVTQVQFKDSAYSDAATFKTAMSGVQLVYELATPITIQLTPNQVNSLLGVNNLWADSGDTEVEYRADTKLFIERLTAPDSADMVADANITSGKYFMVGNSLFKATANIANGAQIIVGTNAVRKSLSEALNEINA